jgi:hypothetical protein
MVQFFRYVVEKVGRGEWIRTTDLLVPNLGKPYFVGVCR